MRHVEIAATIEEWIRSGRFGPGARFPTEAELQESFQAARGTIRKALLQLSASGVLVRERRRGSHVSPTARLLPVRQEVVLNPHGHSILKNAVGRMLSRSEVAPDAGLTRLFRLKRGQAVTEFTFSHSIAGSPVVYLIEHMPPWAAAVVPSPPAGQLPHIDEALARAGFAAARESQWVSATLTDAPLAAMLDLGIGTPVLRLRRLRWLADGRVISHLLSYFRADRYEFEIMLPEAETKESSSSG